MNPKRFFRDSGLAMPENPLDHATYRPRMLRVREHRGKRPANDSGSILENSRQSLICKFYSVRFVNEERRDRQGLQELSKDPDEVVSFANSEPRSIV